MDESMTVEMRRVAVALLSSLEEDAGDAIAADLVAQAFEDHGTRGVAALVLAMRDVSSLLLNVAELTGATRAEVVQEVGLALAGDVR